LTHVIVLTNYIKYIKSQIASLLMPHFLKCYSIILYKNIFRLLHTSIKFIIIILIIIIIIIIIIINYNNINNYINFFSIYASKM